MSTLGGGVPDLSRGQALPPREQRILAPSTVDVVWSDMGNSQCVCALRVTDVVNLTMYYVPMTEQMCAALANDMANAAGLNYN